jgi:hypothetical protein
VHARDRVRLVRDNICVTAGAQPFSCEPERATEPDDTTDTAFALGALDCVSVAAVLDSCMDEADAADWVGFSTREGCSGLSADVRITFPTAFEELGLELWDLDANERIAVDVPCASSDEGGEELRCLKAPLVPSTRYAVQVLPTGEGACEGHCAYNRYTLRMQLSEAR